MVPSYPPVIDTVSAFPGHNHQPVWSLMDCETVITLPVLYLHWLNWALKVSITECGTKYKSKLCLLSDLYEDLISSSRLLHNIFAQIRSTLTAEHELEGSALELIGTLDVIMSSSTFANSSDVS